MSGSCPWRPRPVDFQPPTVKTGAVPCCIALLALSAPRFAIFLVVLFSDYIGDAYETRVVPLLGFFFLPLTTLAYSWAIHSRGSVEGIHLGVVVVAALMDLGILGGSHRARKRTERQE